MLKTLGRFLKWGYSVYNCSSQHDKRIDKSLKSCHLSLGVPSFLHSSTFPHSQPTTPHHLLREFPGGWRM